ncbi:hypothetical protein F0P96_17800 [Hymenobacter busanensis]|uniref:Uncharacterized protein n=1 Tax=Hymenobacter busanensis TaxID=2607656 RepID=A0A7L5A3B0_9BACT|nr:hypothetical protein [Hymenobacter busanensis]KAA9327093.1 hypothetical protein F0P96_17800 [Hymenobacter busanensis]QHJ09545.1 hypothetical protein GUY19_20615 [Hymenobacter busanensis]
MRFSFLRLFALTAPALALVACHKQPIGRSQPATKTHVVDGQPYEWADSLRLDAASGLQYQVANDARNVYLRLRATDAPLQARLVYQGLTVWLDSAGTHRQQFGVQFPLGGGFAPVRPQPNASAADRLAIIQQVLAGTHEMKLLHYKGNLEPVLTETRTLIGVQAAAAVDAAGALNYELAVPLRLLYKRGAAFANGRRPTIGLTFATGLNTAVSGTYGTGTAGDKNVIPRGSKGKGDAQTVQAGKGKPVNFKATALLAVPKS